MEMTTHHPGHRLAGRPLRYFLTEAISGRGICSVAELVEIVEAGGFHLSGRASKVVSDALRWEIAHGRVVRVGRGRYGPGHMPKQTRSWIRCRVRTLVASSSCHSSGSSGVSHPLGLPVSGCRPLVATGFGRGGGVTKNASDNRDPDGDRDPTSSPVRVEDDRTDGDGRADGDDGVDGVDGDGRVLVVGGGWDHEEADLARPLDAGAIAALLGQPPGPVSS